MVQEETPIIPARDPKFDVCDRKNRFAGPHALGQTRSSGAPVFSAEPPGCRTVRAAAGAGGLDGRPHEARKRVWGCLRVGAMFGSTHAPEELQLEV